MSQLGDDRAPEVPSPDRGPTAWFVMPVYRDVESFMRLRSEIIHELARSDLLVSQLQFVVVDDSAGMDPEVAGLASLTDVKVLTPPFNLGHQRAIVFGLRTIEQYVRETDVVVTMDADGEDRPQDVPRLLEVLLREPDRLETVVVARRTKRRERLVFRILYAGFIVLFRFLTGTTIRSGNFAAQRGYFVRRAIDHPSFDLCYSSSLVRLDRQLLYVPCPRGERFAGHSRMGVQNLLIHGVRMMLPFADRIAVRSLVFFAGALFTTLIFAISLLVSAVLFGAPPSGTLVAVLVAAATLSCLSLGVFLVLFSGFAQSSAIGLKGIEVDDQSAK